MNANESYAVFAIAATVILSFCYFLILDKIKKAKGELTRPIKISLYIWRKISGYLILGALPAIIVWVFFKDVHPGTLFLTGESGHLWLWISGTPPKLALIAVISR
jgi:hypothetical protein